MPRFPNEIEYSEKYTDDYFEYRHVLLPKNIYKVMQKNVLLSEDQWRKLGLKMSKGWKHYHIHTPEPYILLFRRPKGTNPVTGEAPKGFKEEIYLLQQSMIWEEG